MPCCTLIALLLSQLGIAGGSISMRLSEGGGAGRLVPVRSLLRWRWAGLAITLAVELMLEVAAAPLIIRYNGRDDAAASFRSAWRLCTTDSLPAR